MKRVLGYIGLLACLSGLVFIIIRQIDAKGPIAVTLVRWTASPFGGDTNIYAVVQITNRTAKAVATGLAVKSLNPHGEWEPVPEKLIFEPQVANTMIIMPGRSSTNLMLKWLPRRGSRYRVEGYHQIVLSRREGAGLQFFRKFGVSYPFVKEGVMLPVEIGAPNQTVQRTEASRSDRETNLAPRRLAPVADLFR